MSSEFSSLPSKENPLTAGTGFLDHAARSLVQAFQGCLLLPVRPGVAPDSVPLPLATETNSAANVSQFATNSIAVVLGNRCRGLLALRFEGEAALNAFLKRNPVSRSTLITAHSGQLIIWHRTEVAHRTNLQIPGLTVLMRGNVLIHDRAALQCRDALLNISEISAVELSALEWGPDPDGIIAAWLAVLTHGEFFRRGGRGQMIPNTHGWRSYLAARLKPTAAYETRSRQFYHFSTGDDWQALTDAQMRDELHRLVRAAPVGSAEARARVTDEWLSLLCRRLRSSLATQLPAIGDRLCVYLQQHLVVEPGANVTNGELFEDFDAHCKETGQPSLSPMKFKVLIGQVLRGESWRVGYSKSITRPGGQQNGWRGVRLRDQRESSWDTHGADGADGALGAKS